MRPAGFSSPRPITSSSSIAARPSATTPCRPVTASRHRCCAAWDTCSASYPIWMPPSGPLRAGWPMLQQYPQAHMSLANALEDFLSSIQILIVRGDAPQIESWSANLSALYAPTRMNIRHSPRCRGAPARARREARRGRHRGLCVHRHDVFGAAHGLGGDRTRTHLAHQRSAKRKTLGSRTHAHPTAWPRHACRHKMEQSG